MEIISYLIYLIASILFIFGIKKLGSPKTARQGNFLSSLGMFLAVVITLFDQRVLTFEYILIGIIIGSAVGAVMALKVPMTGMPQMVGLLNGFGGGASALVAFAEYYHIMNTAGTFDVATGVTLVLSVLIGAVTFTGSFIAFGKLQGFITGKVVKYPLQNPINILLLLMVLAAGVIVVLEPANDSNLLGIAGVSLILGVLLVLPIGGADMPVAVSLLNSYSGLAASMTGFVLQNNMLIIAGALVGASGIILTLIMCRGMNRSLMNVVLGGWEDAGSGGAGSGDGPQGDVKSVDAEELAMILDSAQNVVIVPGYGMAVAQAQHAVRDLTNILEKKNINVRFAIHPVAGRMPGHMNVLLAEAQVSYDKLFALEDINDDFPNVDVALIIGANDVVNPAARHDQSSPIYGMPILNVDYAKTVVINKRSMNVGYAGIQNELFFYPNALMFFGSAKEAVNKLVNEIKEL
ncbi:MAG: NAD(P)(+) transhydrogenase (Re/Si-specific) subunit beta [Ignavibacteriae bacterium]|nr:NAD(P)(+) transhydrogenase (Re/Si-specific) subunit beta [Ignavibacteriota bacterium]MCB9207531.1 NAD(P)(+) transhydrogenase (Re/Si-specific) subunit beta [Ignavibacteriales bacterium]MCB9209061.1 NAD(P)(+) transhydrogenase (Re/Si-specific) subunit beta [Ignavibacteriales bacterium]MCB9218018.1 NAD(P)(+) transhydrogenase (Re/Si-specific) subunit beta [Ignavibacteriales bacterium]MCB9260407.1 NAD(P)(+) transhydrogenase (Re/Si-specific) subunit beta [Ignavibacteriales bacterium]